jgi:putative peptidoglycan lipid II flippase
MKKLLQKLLGDKDGVWRRVLKASAQVGGLNLIARMVGVVNVSIIAAHLGAGVVMDAYAAAQILPNYAINVLSGSISMAFMPIYIDVKLNEGREAANRLFASIQAVTFIILTACMVLLGLLGPLLLPFVARGANGYKLELARNLFYIVLPLVVVNGVVANWSALLNSEEDFVTPGIAPNIMSFIGVIYLPFVLPRWGVYGLAWLMDISSVAQLVNLGWAIRKRKITLMPSIRAANHNTRRVVYQFLPLMAGNSIASSGEFVDSIMAAQLGTGALAALNYGQRLYQVFSGIAIKSLSTAVRPYMAKLVGERDWSGLASLRRRCNVSILGASAVVILVITVLSHTIIQLMMQHGHFNAHDTARVSLIQIMFFLNLPFYTMTTVEVALIGAMQRTKWLMLSAAVTFLTNFLFDRWLMRIMGAAGIALATALVYVVSYFLLASVVNYESRRIAREGGPK